MESISSPALILLDIWSMKVFVWACARLFTFAVDANGGFLDSHLFFYERYSDLAEYHRVNGHTAKSDEFAAIAEAFYQLAPDDDDPPEAAAMAMPAPRQWMQTNAVSSAQVPSSRTDKLPELAVSLVH